jgi:CxxC-x17-CxxC domain-containing protein
MGSFNRDNRSGGDRGGNRFGKPSFGGKSFGGGRRFDNDRGDRKFGGGFDKPQMHDAICSQCGKPCQVPFRPTGGREIFCSNCFKDKKHDGPMRPAGNNFGGRPSFDRPSFDKKPTFGGGNNNEQFKQQFEALNNKLDKILKALSPAVMEVKEDDADEEDMVPAKKSKEALIKTKPAAKKAATKKKK